jgi:hypothetical protein
MQIGLFFNRFLMKYVGFKFLALVSVLCLFIYPAQSGVFEFADEVNGIDTITHPTGYVGFGTDLVITVGISPFSAHADVMETSVQNAINTWNALIPTAGNVIKTNNNVPNNQFDFESVALHELGHCIGLGHPNLASESGVTGSDKNFTSSTRGANNQFDLDSGVDGVIGSADDLRGDDVNIHWFNIENNNPFALADIVDKTTYSQDLDDLPLGDRFVTNADRNVSALLNVENTEAVMQQGIQSGETRRTFAADDVATLRLGMSGLDMLAETADDYTVTLRYDGLTDAADIVFDFDDQASFAACQITGSFVGQDRRHIAITKGHISLNTNFLWFFNDVETPLLPIVTILANSVTDSTTLNQGEDLSLVVKLDPGVSAGKQADYWVRAITPVGEFWLDDQLQFRPSDAPIRAFGGLLLNLPAFTILDGFTTGWPLGIYTVTFAVDDNLDNIFDATFEDAVTFTINP